MSDDIEAIALFKFRASIAAVLWSAMAQRGVTPEELAQRSAVPADCVRAILAAETDIGTDGLFTLGWAMGMEWEFHGKLREAAGE